MEPNPLKDAQNILGFLLAGFAGALGFLGLRSAEVTTVLRNDSKPASLVALVLLFAVLAAVFAVAVSARERMALPRGLAILFLVLALGSFVIYATPIVSANPYEAVAGYLGLGLLAASAISLLFSFFGLKTGVLPSQLAWLVTSVILLAVSVYGAMRLETQSQLNSSVQVSASLSKGAHKAVLSVHVTAFKMQDVGYIGVVVKGLPTWVRTANDCRSGRVTSLKDELGEHTIQCSRDPCFYLPRKCRVIFDGVVPPDANGNVNDVLTDGIVPNKYQDIDILTSICKQRAGCNGDKSTSRFDLHLSNQQSATAP